MAMAKGGRQHDIAHVPLALLQSESEQIPPPVTQAMLTMLVKGELNPADIGQLYTAYFEPFPPPVDLIRDPFFVELLIDALFDRPKINVEHR